MPQQKKSKSGSVVPNASQLTTKGELSWEVVPGETTIASGQKASSTSPSSLPTTSLSESVQTVLKSLANLIPFLPEKYRPAAVAVLVLVATMLSIIFGFNVTPF